MRKLGVIVPGFQTTVQDTGRPGFAHLGVSASGAADAVSMRLGNLLTGNPPNTAALEMTLVGGTFLFGGPATIAITGSDFEPRLDRVPVRLWTAVRVKAGQRLEFAATRSGARCYLCISGGIVVPHVFQSASTHLMTRLGGHLGRALRKGDELDIGARPGKTPKLMKAPEPLVAALVRHVVRVTEGPQLSVFSPVVLHEFVSSTYVVSEESNRMGIRLLGKSLAAGGSGGMLTEGVSLGAVQVPPGGQPIILFVEHQTTGGYPKIANVISADMHAVGQLRPRDSVPFEFVSLEKAWELLAELEQSIRPESLVPCDA